MLFDTDVIIWALRGNGRVGRTIERAESLEISVVSAMELLKGARDRREARLVKSFLADLGFQSLPLTERIGHRAAIYVEEYGLKSNLGLADALIAATAVEHDLTLCTGNARDYRAISELRLKVFQP
jgi:predicted nucleic acid-binding protein